jgi:hypothetical protein
MKSYRSLSAALALVVAHAALAQQAPIANWPAPATWTRPSTGRTAEAGFPPLPFIPLTPCRLVDTRGGAPLTGGFLPPATVRSYTITGICGLPVGAQAVSLNATVTNPAGPGFLTLYPQGGTFPPVSTLNYLAGQTIVNAAVVPISAGGGISMALGVSGGDVILDINGFYGPTSSDPTLYFQLNTNSLGYTMLLNNQSTTCVGVCGLFQTVQSGIAIEGKTYSSSALTAGVEGIASAGNGLLGTSSTNNGIVGTTGTTGGDLAGVVGRDPAAPSVVGSPSAGVRGEGTYGVVGFSSASFGVGVFGQGFTPAYMGVHGEMNTSGGYGVHGQANFPATWGVYANGNLGATGTKPFVEPHPTDATKEIRYVALEGPEAGTYFRGSSTTVGGVAVIEVPETFRAVSAEDGLTVHLTPVGALAQLAVISRDLNRIVVHSSRDVAFDYLVHGVRRAFRDWQVVSESSDFRPLSPDQKLPSYLSEEARRRLVANGTYNADGSVNLETAERLGWAQAWRERPAAAASTAVVERP